MLMRKFRFEVRNLAVALCAAASLSLIACSSGSNNNGGMGGAKDASADGTGAGGKGTGGKGMGGNGQGGAGGQVSLACSQPKYSHTSGFGAILDGWVVAANSTPPSLAPTLDADGGTISGTKVEIDKTDGS